MIIDGWLDWAIRKDSPNFSGNITPEFIVMHYTASWRAEGAIRTLTTRSAKVSAQFVVDTDGTVTQLVSCTKKAWHAGPSSYNGVKGLNSHSIGIEIVNPGYLKAVDGGFKDSNGRFHSADKVQQTIKTKDPRVGSGDWHWPMYPKPQLMAVERVTAELIAMYGITDIVSHRQIDTRGWKTDPGPAFPMKHMRDLLDVDDALAQTNGDFASPMPVPKPQPSLAIDDPTDEPLKGVPQPDERGHGHGDMNFFERVGHRLWHIYDNLF